MNRWQRRIDRTKVLAIEYPAAAEILRFYRELLVFQSDPKSNVGDLLALLKLNGTGVLVERAAKLTLPTEDWDREDPVNIFLLRVLEQPAYEQKARESQVDTRTVQSTCPFCFDKPLVAILRPEGDGGRRTLQCGRCFTEWEFRRVLCPNCGEEDREKLPVYRVEEFPNIRVEACDACSHYIKAVDMTRDGNAVPEVDEIASLSLDLWAQEKGYEKMAPNLFW